MKPVWVVPPDGGRGYYATRVDNEWVPVVSDQQGVQMGSADDDHENARIQRRKMVSDSVHRVLQRINVANPGGYADAVRETRIVPTQDGNTVNDHGLDAYEVSFRLPRFNGKAFILRSELTGQFDRNALLSDRTQSPVWDRPAGPPTADDLQRSMAIRRAQSALDAAIEPIVQRAARELRGRAILELIEQDWDIKDASAEHWQKLEHAAMKIFAMVEERRK